MQSDSPDRPLTKTIEALLEKLRPEAGYFWAEEGERAGLLIFDMADAREIPEIAEPPFLTCDAAVDFTPVMNAADRKAALAKVGGKD